MAKGDEMLFSFRSIPNSITTSLLKLRKSNGTDELVLDILQGLYNCDYNVLLRSLQIWQILEGKGHEDVKNPSWIKYFPECHGEQKGCVEKIVKQCGNSIALVSKVPRVSLSLAAQLLKKVRSLKIIHLLRDPRAIMKSRKVLEWTPPPAGSLSLCRKMADDYLQSDIIKKDHPARLLTVFYEDLVTHPAETVQMMYDFAGYDFDEKEQSRLSNMTGMTPGNMPISSDRKTSLQVAMEWRTKINLTFLNAIDPGCKDLYKILGYPPLNSETDIHNSSIPLRIIG
ncbi:carbohydrate sulfotransferase 4-like [Pecten maximus]|uniref:carbohydrate sulfotransferase 4-like n=1 Tax=Pecten maximus TaxID=6579 RepID=UPI001458C887|nr:carbohydrate sulfotransferase 4-like [Pecten maximus]